MNKNISYFFKLLQSSLNNQQPPEPDADVDFKQVYKFAKAHNLLNVCFYSVEKLENKPEKALYKKWENHRNMMIHRNMIQKMEFDSIKSILEKNRVAFMPIKGFSISDLYPKSDFRYMADLDFLIKDDLEKADRLIETLGYKPKILGTVHHDEYVKPPFMIVELHHEIISISSPYYSYYKNIFDRCLTDNQIEYRMSDEDFYIFMLVHLQKHYMESGTGIRSILDFYFLNKKFLPDLDKEYINREVEKLNLTDFYNMVLLIAEKWFGQYDFSNLSKEELYILGSGTYGNEENKVINRKGDKKGISFFVSRLFPPVLWMKDHFHILRKYPVLLPVMYVYRFFKAVFCKKKMIKNELEILNQHKCNS